MASHTKSFKTNPQTEMILRDCSNFSIEHHMPTVVTSRNPFQNGGKEMLNLCLLIETVQAQLQKHTNFQITLLEKTMCEMKLNSSNDEQMNQMMTNVHTNFEEFHQMLEQFKHKTGPNIDSPNTEMIAAVTNLQQNEEKTDEAEKLSDKENREIKVRNDNTTKFQQAEKWIRQLDPEIITKIVNIFEPSDNWVMEKVCTNVEDLVWLRRLCLHMANYEKSCGDKDCPTCGGEDIRIYECDDGKLKFANGKDFIQEVIEISKSVKCILGIPLSMTDKVMKFIKNVYPEVIKTFGHSEIENRVNKAIKGSVRSGGRLTKSTKKHNLRKRSFSAPKKCKFC